MVARIVTGKSIKGAVLYNENKVAAGKAEIILAHKYLAPAEKLTPSQRLFRLEDLARRNERAKTNCVHISLNFDPKEHLSNDKLAEISKEYLNKIGLGDQPFLLYKHYDAAHPHIHIVTTNIQSDGTRISMHNVGRDKSEPIRKAIEQKFGLVAAEGSNQSEGEFLKPADLTAATYGRSETKKAISNIVRTIVRSYNFISIAELNAVLNKYNIVADPGEEGSRMHTQKGLVYCMLDKSGTKRGVPIKASSIYTKPTLKSLEVQFEKNKEKRGTLRKPLATTIDKVIANPNITNRKQFSEQLTKQGIDVIYRENITRVYGITFIDHRSKVVFNGSDLGKNYSAASILSRIASDRSMAGRQRKVFEKTVNEAISAVDFTAGPASLIAQLDNSTLRLDADDKGNYCVASKLYQDDYRMPLSANLDRFLKNSGITPPLLERLNISLENHPIPRANPLQFVSTLIQSLLQQSGADQVYRTERTKRRKRKP